MLLILFYVLLFAKKEKQTSMFLEKFNNNSMVINVNVKENYRITILNKVSKHPSKSTMLCSNFMDKLLKLR